MKAPMKPPSIRPRIELVCEVEVDDGPDTDVEVDDGPDHDVEVDDEPDPNAIVPVVSGLSERHKTVSVDRVKVSRTSSDFRCREVPGVILRG